jgi:Protein of unknown function (DUF1573)
MKRNSSLHSLAFLMLVLLWNGAGIFAQTDTNKVVPAFEWANKTYDFGKIPQGKPVTAEFQFRNPSMAPLIINSVRPSCGCTVADYPKEPILPQKSGTIKVTYNAANMGPFQKSVSVASNTGEQNEILFIKGEVIAEGEQNPPSAAVK